MHAADRYATPSSVSAFNVNMSARAQIPIAYVCLHVGAYAADVIILSVLAAPDSFSFYNFCGRFLKRFLSDSKGINFVLVVHVSCSIANWYSLYSYEKGGFCYKISVSVNFFIFYLHRYSLILLIMIIMISFCIRATKQKSSISSAI